MDISVISIIRQEMGPSLAQPLDTIKSKTKSSKT